jgi:hypothetical protein
MEFAPPPTQRFEADIGPEHLDRYARDGFLVIDRITSDEELEWLRGVYDTLLAMPTTGFLDGIFDLSRPYGDTTEPQLGQLLAPDRFVKLVHLTSFYQNAQRISSKLLKLPIPEMQTWCHLIFKGAMSPAETPWHQDEAYWEPTKRFHTLATWLPLDDVDTENGCLWYVPGSHRGEVRRHRHGGNDPAVHVLEFAEPADTSGAVPILLRAGGMTFHTPRTFHFSGVNRTNRIRRAWGTVFQSQPMLREAPAPHSWWHEGKAAHAERLKQR